jgi:hypothetical protein
VNSVIAFVPATVGYHDLVVALGGIGTAERLPDGGFVFLHGPDRLYLHVVDDRDTDYDPTQLGHVRGIVGDYAAYTLDYSDIETIKNAIGLLASRWRCVIDNDHGLIAEGREFTNRMTRAPDWDWRIGSS